MSPRRRLMLLGLLLAVAMVALLAIGCGGETSDDSGTAAGRTGPAAGRTGPAEARSVLTGPQDPPGEETPYYGGTMTILHQYGPTNMGASWEPTQFMDVQAARFAVENLIGVDRDGNPVPQLAESWDENEDFTEFTFYLREGVKFHDGTDFNAEAAKWNIQMYVDSAKTDIDHVSDIEVVDDYTLKVTLSESDVLFVQKMFASHCGSMVSPAAYDEYGPVKIKRNPTGTGPFKLTDFTLGKEVVFEAFEDYWQEGLPYLDGVRIVVIPDYQSRKAAFLNGEGHIMYGANYTDAGELEAAGNALESRIMALITLAGRSDDPSDPMSDIKVREALTYALDIPTIVNGVYEGYVSATNQLALPPGGLLEWDQVAYNPDILGYPYDEQKAKDLLAESEFNISVDNPWKTELIYLSSEDYDQVFTLVQEYLAKVGIEVTLNPLEYAAWSSAATNGWDGLGAMSMTYNPGVEYSSTLQQNLSEDAWKFGNHIFIPEEFNALYREMMVETDLDARYEMYQELNKIAIDDYCLVTPMYALLGNIAESPELKDNVWCVRSSGEFLVEQIWLEH